MGDESCLQPSAARQLCCSGIGSPPPSSDASVLYRVADWGKGPLPPSPPLSLAPSVLRFYCIAGEGSVGEGGRGLIAPTHLLWLLLSSSGTSFQKESRIRGAQAEWYQRKSFKGAHFGHQEKAPHSHLRPNIASIFNSRYILHIVHDYIQHLSFPLFRLDMHGNEIFLTKVKRVVLDKRHKRERENQHERNYVRNAEMSRRLRSDTRRRRIYLFL